MRKIGVEIERDEEERKKVGWTGGRKR